MTTRAQWVDGIPDLYEEGKLEEAGNYLTEVQVSELTGFAVTTIMNALSRQKITSTTNPLGPISRPVRRIGSKPLYSREQAEAALELRHKGGRKRFGGQDEPLPSVTFEESERCGYRSVADLADQVGVHEQTVRSWFRMYATAPKPVALRERHPDDPKGAPSVVFEGGPALQWMVDNDKIDPSMLKAA
jgi:hypothetical protein